VNRVEQLIEDCRKQLADLSPWYGPNREQGALLQGAYTLDCIPGVYIVAGIHS
jgi:hypothetical protein